MGPFDADFNSVARMDGLGTDGTGKMAAFIGEGNTVKLYGISNCDTVRKARTWLTEQGADFTFHDFRKDGLDEQKLRDWGTRHGWEKLVNRQGLTWKKLDEATRSRVSDLDSAVELMRAKPTVIKRPILEVGDQSHVGFDPDAYLSLLAPQGGKARP